MENTTAPNPVNESNGEISVPKGKRKFTFYLFILIPVLIIGTIIVANFGSTKTQVVTTNASNAQADREERNKQASANENLDQAFQKTQIPAPSQKSPAPMGKQERGIEASPFDVPRINPNSPVAEALNSSKDQDTRTQTDPRREQQITGSPTSTTFQNPSPENVTPPQPQVRPVRSGYFFGNETASPVSQPTVNPTNVSNSNQATLPAQGPVQRYVDSVADTPKPAFGAFLPIRLLGSLLTLGGQNLVRCEITRDVGGKNWKLQRGTQLIGEIKETVGDRVFIRINGYIDPKRNRFVPMKCEVFSSDGASGIKGERKRLNSRIAYILKRAFEGGLTLGQAALSRGNSVIVPTGQDLSVLTGVNPTNDVQVQSYLKIDANVQGFALVTEIPGQIEPDRENNGAVQYQFPDSSINASTSVASPEEIALLETVNSEEELKAVLPKLNPRFRQIVLNAMKRQ